jgi:signal transduction histidine kinase
MIGSLRDSPQQLQHFEALMAEVAGALVRVTANGMDSEINKWLERIGMSLGLDRSTIAEINPVTGVARFTHGWSREPDRIITAAVDANTALPWIKQKMIAGERVVMPSPDELPEGADIDRESFHRYGTKSAVMVPIKLGGVVVGAISFASLYEARSWPPDLVQKFESVAEIFGFGLERKRAVAELARLRNELSYVAGASATAELAASMAHELNQPLAAILSNAEAVQAILASDRPDLDEVKAGIADIIHDNNRAREIIQRVWALFRRGQVTKSRIEVAEVLDEVQRIIGADASNRNISFSIGLKQPIPAIIADRVQIQQAIMNLVSNAFDAVAGTGKEPREVRLEARSADANCGVLILVRDSGKGITRDAMPRIFDAFFTTKPKGMGMGLTIAKSIIEAHGGNLSVAASGDRDTTFEIMLPLEPSC